MALAHQGGSNPELQTVAVIRHRAPDLDLHYLFCTPHFSLKLIEYPFTWTLPPTSGSRQTWCSAVAQVDGSRHLELTSVTTSVLKLISK